MRPILITAAVLPAIILMVYVYRKDKLEKEPTGLLIALVILGMISTALAMFAETVGERILSLFLTPNSLLYNLLLYYGVVAFGEEGAKYVLLKRRTWNSPYFTCQFDGVIYAVFVALGFALWENIGYVLEYGFATAVVRAVTAVPGHASFGVFMGAWYGLARRYAFRGNEAASRRCRRLALLVPAFLHGTYDFIATMESSAFSLIFIAFVGIMFLVALRMVKRLSATDHFIDGRERTQAPFFDYTSFNDPNNF